MTDWRRIFAGLAGLLVLTVLPAIPQNGPAAPRGSYLQTCSQIRREGNILFATCDRPNDLSEKSTIDVSLCDGDISNNYGHLSCYARRGTWGQGRAIPRGSYTDSCENVMVVGTKLKVKCKSRDGGHIEGALDLTKCRMGSNITNLDGYLVCRD